MIARTSIGARLVQELWWKVRTGISALMFALKDERQTKPLHKPPPRWLTAVKAAW
jgi:hypothetical protein